MDVHCGWGTMMLALQRSWYRSCAAAAAVVSKASGGLHSASLVGHSLCELRAASASSRLTAGGQSWGDDGLWYCTTAVQTWPALYIQLTYLLGVQPMQHKLELYKTHGRGWGLRALQSIESHTFVCAYTGDCLSEAA